MLSGRFFRTCLQGLAARLFALAFVGLFGLAAVTGAGSAAGVRRERKARQPLPESARLQIAWTMVRSRVTSFGATSRNENYRETWHLWRKLDGSLVLISPRAKVAVHQAMPDQSLVTSEGDLATLLGLLPRPVTGGKIQGNLVASAMARPLSIDLREPRTPVQAQFSFGDEESYAVTLEIQSLKSE